MANPNIAALATIKGQTGYLKPAAAATSNTNWTYDGVTALTGLTPAANSVNRINTVVASNLTANAASITLSVSDNPTFASGNAYPIVYNVSVPANASLVVSDKSTIFYITENQSLAANVTAASAISVLVSYETIS
jgi:hypothetical protein